MLRRCGGALLVAWVAVAGACTSDEWPPRLQDTDGETESEAGSSTGGVDLDDAHLVVFEPQGSAIHLLDEPVPLLAELQDDEGLPLPATDVVWKSDAVGPALLQGLDGEAVLPPGKHDITAIARLPNGDRLETRVQDVRVQSRWTGRYEGTATLVLQVEFQGFPLSVACQGPLEMTVDVTGQQVELSSGQCQLNLVLLEVMASYELTGEFSATGIASGVIRYDLGTLGPLEMDWTGAFIEDGFGGSYEGSVMIPLVGTAPAVGTLSLLRTNPFVEP